MVAACSADEPRDGTASGFEERDSAGITIARSTGPAWSATTGWSLSEEPIIEIGTLEGPDETSFSRVAGILLRQDGTVVVADRGASELRFFDEAGTFLRRVGRPGDGPGEFGAIESLHRYRGDSIAVWDGQRRIWTILDGSGALGRTIRPEVSSGNLRSIGSFEDGSLMLADLKLESPGATPGTASMDYDEYLAFAPDGELADSLGRFPNARRFQAERGVQALFPEMFGPRGVAATSGRGFYVGTGESHEIGFHDRLGRLTRIVRWSGSRVPVSEVDIDAFRADRAARTAEPMREMMNAAWADAPAADHFPTYEEAVADGDGNLWLAEFRTPRGDTSRRWLVFDPRGQWLGDVMMPRDLVVFDIYGSRVGGVVRDEFDVERVRVFSLIKPD
jgi:hypothetical protein